MIDSELVPWGKGEKQAGEAVEIEPETMCLQGTDARSAHLTKVSCSNEKLKNKNVKLMSSLREQFQDFSFFILLFSSQTHRFGEVRWCIQLQFQLFGKF